MKPIYQVFTVVFLFTICAFWGWQEWQSILSLRPDYELASRGNLKPPFIKGLPKNQQCKVSKVLSGNQLRVICGWQTFTALLCGIDAPIEGQPFYNESKDNLQKLVDEVAGKVDITFHEEDRSGRQIVEIYTNVDTDRSKLLNVSQTQAGMAYNFVEYSDRCINQVSIANGEDEAREKKLGVWSGKFQRPLEYRKSKTTKQ